MKAKKLNPGYALLFVLFILAGSPLYGQYAGGPTDVCRDTPAEYAASSDSGCNFSAWNWSGVATIVEGSRTSDKIKLVWESSGQLWASFSCGTSEIVNVTLHNKPTVTIAASATEIFENQFVTLTASGAQSYSWSGPSVNVNETRNPITVFPPVGDDLQFTVTGTDQYSCSNTGKVLIDVVRVPLDAGPDRSYCKDLHSIDLNSWGLSLAAGTWTGQGISNGVINLDLLSPGQYPYTYTRTADGQSDGMMLTVLNSFGGVIRVAQNNTCQAAQGSLFLDNTNIGAVQYWERSTNNGLSWALVSSSESANSISFNEPVKTQFRAAVKNGTCALVYSDPVAVEPLNPVGGFLSVETEQLACGRTYGTLRLQNYSGDKFTWEVDAGSGFAPVTGASGDFYSYDVSQQTSFRVKVEKTTGTCEGQYSTLYTAYTASRGGVVATSTHDFCETATGILNLSQHLGLVTNWEHSTDNTNWTPLSESAGQVAFSFTTTESVSFYRAVVTLTDCTPAYSNVVQINVSTGEQAGKVVLLSETSSGAADELIFRATFQLLDHAGDIKHWRAQTGVGTTTDPNTQSTWTTDITTTTAVSALVQAGVCDPLYSARAIFVVNAPFQGILRVINLVVLEYDGHSYQYGEGLSLQEPFSFHANSGQEFFVVLDENYSIPPPDENYVLKETVMAEGLMTEEDVVFANAHQRSSNYTYFDGLGRPIQEVYRKASPEQKDIVKPEIYDAMGRRFKDMLPYVAEDNDGFYKESATLEQKDFYANPGPAIASSDYPFSLKVFETSPRNKVVEHGAPGADWQPGIGHTLKFNEQVNNANEIKRWEVTDDGRPVSNAYYYQGDLLINVTTDAHGSLVKEYRDKSNLVVLREVQNGSEWLQTCFIYDSFDLLRFAIQPEGMAQLAGNPDDQFLMKWAFQYRYDQRRRMVEKSAPGSAAVFYIFDDAGRLILTQDGNQRAKNEWSFIKYDALGRSVVTGLYTFRDAIDPDKIVGREELLTKLSPMDATESYNGQPQFYGYTNVSFPTTDLEVLTVNYYDDYSVLTDLFNNEFKYVPEALAGMDAAPFDRVKSRLTAHQTKILGTSTFLRSVTWYDRYYRTIQTLSEDFEGAAQLTSQRFDFAGNVMARSIQHRKGNTINVGEEFTYDHTGRLLTQHHRVGSGPKILLKSQRYNQLGQLVEKNLHGKQSGFAQSVDYRYNIQGWLTNINNPALINDGGITNDEANDFFGFELRYNNPTATGGTAQFNGNISQTIWKSIGTNRQTYGYTYDALDRLKQADYFDLENVTRAERYSEHVLEYDRNGNIRRLHRNGLMDEPGIDNMSPYGSMDNLQYEYDGNRLSFVTDDITATTEKEGGFKDQNKTGLDYDYDINGNMRSDKNKEILSVTYNHLNLPVTVTKVDGGSITYTYDASGRKVSQSVIQPNSQKKTDYHGLFIYEDGLLQSILDDEGRVVMENGSSPEHQYFLRDHLGNVRLTFTTREETLEKTATFETAMIPNEQAHFLFYDEAVTVNTPIFDHTDQGPTYYSTRLNGSAQEQYGISKSLSVMPGDTIRAQVYAKYADPDQDNWEQALTDLVTAIANNTAPAGTLIDGGATGSIGNATFPLEGILDKSNETSVAPKAYLNWIVFDRDYNFKDGGYVPVTEAAKETGEQLLPHELLEKEIIIEQAGFVYLYLSNDNVELGGAPADVFFDDFKVEHVKSAIVAEQSYYPFGLTFNAYSREGSVDLNFKFQGQEHVDDLGLNWDSFKWRNHMPDIGRFFNMDPLADHYVYNSPYAFSENDVVNAIELEGLERYRVTFFSPMQTEDVDQLIHDYHRELKSGEIPTGEKENEIMRIQIYGLKYGFVDNDGKKSDYIIRKLKQAGIPLNRMVELNNATNRTEMIQKDGDFITEYFGTRMNKDGSISVEKLGEINHNKSRDIYWNQVWKKVFQKLLEEGAEELIEKFFPILKYLPTPIIPQKFDRAPTSELPPVKPPPPAPPAPEPLPTPPNPVVTRKMEDN